MTNRASRTDLSEFDAERDHQDELFEVLSDSRRRVLFHSLQAADMPISVEELTTELVAWEAQRPVSDRSGDERDTIEISLVHNHLPKMAEAGFVRYDDTQRTVTLADRTDEVRTHLETMAGD